VNKPTGGSRGILYAALILLPALLTAGSLFIGRYRLGLGDVAGILSDGLGSAADSIPHAVVWELRVPRALLALLVGGSLAVSGGALQGIFRNPLVDAGMLGVSSGAGFGACLAILLFGASTAFTFVFAFAFGILAVFLSFMTSRIYRSAPTIMLVLGGIVISSIFSSLISFTKYVADPDEQLPSITFWLMGSLARANYKDLLPALVPIGLGVGGIFSLRWRINLLSIGDKEAQTMGVNTEAVRIVLIACTALATAGAVCLSGTIGWIGLIIPHIGRMLVGNDNRRLLPVSFSLGACFLLLVDNIGRTIASGEIPIGVLTALLGSPFFIYLLGRVKGGSNW